MDTVRSEVCPLRLLRCAVEAGCALSQILDRSYVELSYIQGPNVVNSPGM